MNSIHPTASIDPAETQSVVSMVSARRDTLIQAEVAAARQRVEKTLLREIEAMVLFALGAGLDLPPEALAARQPLTPDTQPPDTQPPGVLPSGVLSPGLLPSGTGADPLVRLADLHLTLTKLVAPARGASLVLLEEQRRAHPILQAFGPVAQVRWMLATAVLSLVLLLGTALSGDVNPENVSKGLLNLQGTELVVVELFLIAASAVGATLANLKRLNRFISDCNYDPRYDSSYWTRLVMGLISGVILSQVVFGSLVAGDATSGHNSASSVLDGFGQPILAIIGGFSADLVHDILTHLINVIGNTLGLRKTE
jgi:hypothetical protein